MSIDETRNEILVFTKTVFQRVFVQCDAIPWKALKSQCLGVTGQEAVLFTT